jgi:signal transduction histidine kinase
VISTVSGAPELLYAQLARDEFVLRTMADAHADDEDQRDRLRDQLFTHLYADYEILRQLEFRQLHFHLRDNRSLIRFHRPDRYGDDLTTVRATVRITNATQTRTYGFEEGRIFNGFRYVYPLFHRGRHVGSVEASMNYQAIISRMRSSHPVVFDFLLDRDVVDRKVFANEMSNYTASCMSDRFVREREFPLPATTASLGVQFSCILEAGGSSTELVHSLDSYTATTVPFFVEGIPISVSVLPIQNAEGTNVALILGYSRMDEIVSVRQLFFAIGLTLTALTSAVFALFLRIARQRARMVQVSEDLRRTIQSKDRFFSIVSHDLRGPIGSMASLAGMLKTELNELDSVPASTHEMADVLADGAENSSQLLNDLLGWSRSQRGDIAFSPHHLKLHGIVEDQLSTLRRAAAEKQVFLENEVGSMDVRADEYMLKTIIRNLVSNGIKFTPVGGTVSVTSVVHTDGVEVLVTDTGVGMSEEQQNNLFVLDSKTSTLGTSGERGTGLGLTVCREFVDAHGGTLTISSTVNEGSTFRVFLPARSAED